jgi:hypothetical protein
MTKQEVLTALWKMKMDPNTGEHTLGNFVLRWGRNNTYDLRHGSKTICGGEIPTSADPNTYPIRIAIEAVTNMNI